MAKQNWKTERKWEIGDSEQHFIDLLAENEYTIKGIKEWQSKTDYLIEKDGIEQSYEFHHLDNSKKRAELTFKAFEKCFEITKKYYEVKAQIGEV